MNDSRYNYLMINMEAELTKDEMDQGWHFCDDFDGLLCMRGGPGCCCDEFDRKFGGSA